ncbi:aminotransferase class I/II-fold pyridoxal phosphate-dependent enzyme [Cellulomonas chengniuliangii]|uniref:aminotransferase class I/II-fold pyridoxal phosphate-dependent enzyme n=1 Tax=Cellulomonas chengniuliangii TaxID=2968084 RepID=UPI001D0E5348|nr:aminotransferase class I/II-fold pyridoxal phosphate-dependent enzyme [Cellulomonas chengniuliangii]MCC2319350.1 aminotransferase class I/II-fold pyridoxal phosphate-dependent enzyme [Cellulomonas chengniuliangii]
MELGALVAAVDDRSPRGIAATVSRLARNGELRPGDRLPTVRATAAALGVSPATVGSAWRALAAVGMVGARGRAGTFLLPSPTGWLPPRYRDMARGAAAALDLSTGTPDPALLPTLGPALARVGARTPAAVTGTYLSAPLVPELEAALRASWPFPPDRLTVVDGAVDAIERTLGQVARFGDRVAVEDPGFPPLFDLLDQLGLERVPVPLDRQGMRPDGLAAALEAGASTVVLQPRAHNPTGVSLTPTRARDLAAVIRRHDRRAAAAAEAAGTGRRPREVHVIEDDHSGEIASSRDVTLGAHLPRQVVHVRSYSKSHGPDLRIAAVGGPGPVLDAVVARRMLGPGWTSRLLQHVLADLLVDGAAVDAVAHARRVYYARQRTLCEALARHGLAVPPGDGINLWLPVADEATAMIRLEAAGVRVARGTPFVASAAEPGPGHVRVTVASLADGVEEVARRLALAAAA